MYKFLLEDFDRDKRTYISDIMGEALNIAINYH